MMNMADEDEELSHLRAPDAADEDPTEDAQDFLRFDKLVCACSHQFKLFES
jgi:tRNA-splicing endonuclease subunit Sen54